MRIVDRIVVGLVLLLAAGLSTARTADDGIGISDQVLVPSESRIVLHLDGEAAGGVARITLRDGGIANIFDESGKGLQITARQIGPGVVVVDVIDTVGKGLAKDGDVESVDAFGKAHAPITLGIGEAKAIRDLGLTISATFETVARAGSSAPICTDGKVATSAGAKEEVGQCCVRCGGATICAYCVQLSCGWCCAP
jgi:hypothetical protein